MKRVFNLIGKILMILSLVYIGIYLYKVDLDWGLVRKWPLFYVCSFVGCIILVADIFVLGAVWRNLLVSLSGIKINYKDIIGIYAKANMGKYLPGNVMHYVERNIFISDLGVGQKECALSSILEVGFEIVSAVVIGVFFVNNEFRDILSRLIEPKWIAPIFVILTIIVIVGIQIERKYRTISGIFTQLLNKRFLGTAVFSILAYMIVFFSMGFLFLFILTGILQCDLTLPQYGKVISGYILAWLIGFVVPGAPGGLGIREFVLMTIMSSFVPQNDILFAMLFHRVLTVAGDVLAYLLFYVAIKQISYFKR